jgi:thioredoxin reductase/SAM-dependent methyltransferase
VTDHHHHHHHHHHHDVAVERHCDVAVIGGSAAGLAAALQLGRQRRTVIVVDAGDPRNAAASHMHGYLGREAMDPAQFLAAGREEVRSYGGEVLAGRAVTVTREGSGHFRVALTGGHAIIARRVLAATGLVDELPEVAGLARHWGRAVIHCPFCYGFEVRDRRIVQLVTHPTGLHTAPLLRQLTDHHALVLAPDVAVGDVELELLRAGGVRIVRGEARAVIAAESGEVTAVELADGTRVAADAIVVAPRSRARLGPFREAGVRAVAHPSGLGDVVEIDANGETSVAGLFAAGNVTDPSQQVSAAAAQGSRVGAMISFSLAREDLETAVRPRANEVDWDHRYGDTPVWSGNPNGSLVAEASDLPVGRALDVGAGEGGDAFWMAERGWDVTASDISANVLGRIAAEAGRRGLQIECRHVDANALDAYEARAFDLVSAQYASIPRTPDGRGVRNVLDAVKPGGTLLVVSHDLDAMRAPIDTGSESRAFDGDAFVRVTDVAAAIAASPEWDVEVHEKRPRPPGAASAAVHVDDIVLRARRREA